MKYVTICLCLPLLGLSPSFDTIAALAEPTHIEWMTWEEVVSANQNSPRKIIVDVYTDWCTWCKVMDRKTFSQNEIIQYVNEHFYAVRLNAEQKESIRWNNRNFEWVNSGRNGVHQLASALLDGQMSYPSVVFLNEKYERILISKGFKDAATFLQELSYAAEEKYKGEQTHIER